MRKKQLKNNKEKNTLPFFCVGIGASAGGLEALEQFFKNMPAGKDFCFVVVQHLSPDYKSLMVELLSRHTTMKVVRAEDGLALEPGVIYLIPPKKNLTVFHNRLYLTQQDYHTVPNLPIDIFFRSLAEDQGERSIGIILSGTGSDGTLGIRAIKEAGGMIMVQDENSAKFNGMPRSAIATGLVDYILPPEKMPEQLIKYAEHPYIAKTQRIESQILKEEDVLFKILAVIKEKIGVDFTYYKPNTIIRRIERRISVNQISDIKDYVELLTHSDIEVKILFKELLIGVTRFFRDQEAFNKVYQKMLPILFEQKERGESIRVWSVGCSTGEEAYSLAILFSEYMQTHHLYYDVKIFATDLDKQAIEYASVGFYPENIMTDVPEPFLKSYFIQKPGGYQIHESIRKMVIFAHHNVIKDPPFSKIDVIACRNMLIYFKPETQKKVLSLFNFSLAPHGFLFLGSSETIGDFIEYFKTIDGKWKIYQSLQQLKNTMAKELFYHPLLERKAEKILETQKIGFKSYSQADFFYESLVKEYVPPSVIVDEKTDIVHIFKDVNNYLSVPTGKPSLNLLKMAHPELVTFLSTAIHKVKKEKKEIVYKNIVLKNLNKNINLILKPLDIKYFQQEFILIVFEENKEEGHKREDITIQELNINDHYHEKMLELEQELNYTKETLQATIEELETSNEELQSTNEELLASNEELQSTNEELQSVNEELYTVNSEYQSKIEELTLLNNDMNNLLKNTNIGMLFLDNQLRIRKFTPALMKVMHIMDFDIGRPFYHISHQLQYENFVEDIQAVLKDLKPREKETEDKNHNTYLVRINPYRTIENAVSGVVITFIDITEKKIYENKVKKERDFLLQVLKNSPIGKIVVEKPGGVSFVNKKTLEIFELEESEILHQPLSHLKSLLQFDLSLECEKEPNNNYFTYTKNGKSKKLFISKTAICDDDSVCRFVFSIIEVGKI